jgi:hypothetical protein
LGYLTALDKNGWDGYETVLLYNATMHAQKGFPPSGRGHDTPKPLKAPKHTAAKRTIKKGRVLQ